MYLDEIIAQKQLEIIDLKNRESIESFKKQITLIQPALDFKKAISESVSLIAEVKKASPSAGVIKDDFDAVSIAVEYERAGAAAISVLTDEKFFQGSNLYLKSVKNAVGIPVLRKDFVIDEIQIYEARAIGADAILLIAAVLEKKQIEQYLYLAQELGMAAILEIHNKEELKTALNTGARIIGINNRDLKTFKVSVDTTVEIMKMIPLDRNIVLVSESGLKTRDDVEIVRRAGVNAVLIGEELMRSSNINEKIKSLRLSEQAGK